MHPEKKREIFKEKIPLYLFQLGATAFASLNEGWHLKAVVSSISSGPAFSEVFLSSYLPAHLFFVYKVKAARPALGKGQKERRPLSGVS